MIRGEVSARREAVVPLTVRGPTGRRVQVDAVTDTGFSEALALEPRLVADLGLSYQNVSRMVLGDGSVASVNVYEGTVLWDGAPLTILVHAADGGCLIGMGLLYGCDVQMQVVDGGSVIIEPL